MGGAVDVVKRTMVKIVKNMAVCAVLVITLAACSGGDDDDEAATPTTAPTPASSTTLQPVDTRFTGENSAQFCAMAGSYNDSFATIGANATPDQLRTVAREGQAALTQLVNGAPAEIKNDVDVLARTFGGLISQLEKVDFEVSKLPPAALSQLTAPDFQAATTRFQAYNRTVCGGN